MDQRWEIIDDQSAEWALKKIKEATEERDRLLKLVGAARAELDDKEFQIRDKCRSDTEYLKAMLYRYMAGCKCKHSKTQDTYELLTGKLVRKKASKDMKAGEDLVYWLQANHPEYVKTTTAPAWGELKKQLEFDADTGIVTMYGEIVEGVDLVDKPESFDIKW